MTVTASRARDNLIKSAYEFYQNDDKKKAKSLLKDFTKSNFEYSEGKQLFVALGGKNEEKTKGRQANDLFVEKEFADNVANEQYVIKSGGHINSESGYTKFEEILKEI